MTPVPTNTHHIHKLFFTLCSTPLSFCHGGQHDAPVGTVHFNFQFFAVAIGPKKIDLCGVRTTTFKGVQLHLSKLKMYHNPPPVYPGLLLIATHFFSEAQEDICQTAAAAIEMS